MPTAMTWSDYFYEMVYEPGERLKETAPGSGVYEYVTTREEPGAPHGTRPGVDVGYPDATEALPGPETVMDWFNYLSPSHWMFHGITGFNDQKPPECSWWAKIAKILDLLYAALIIGLVLALVVWVAGPSTALSAGRDAYQTIIGGGA